MCIAYAGLISLYLVASTQLRVRLESSVMSASIIVIPDRTMYRTEKGVRGTY